MVFNEDRKNINGMLLIHLPDGPTAQFRLSNLVLSKDIKVRGESLWSDSASLPAFWLLSASQITQAT